MVVGMTTTANPLDLELATIDQQRWRFALITGATIVVSFVHMLGALSLYSGESVPDKIAVFAMTLLIDAATWQVAEYIDYARRRSLKRSPWIFVLFAFALIISFSLNLAYLLDHAPPEERVPLGLSYVLAIAFSLFLPGLIAVGSLARSELLDDRLRKLEGAQAAMQQADQAAADLAALRTERDRLQQELATAKAEAERQRTAHAGDAQVADMLRNEAERLRTKSAQTETALRNEAERVRTEGAQALGALRTENERLRSEAERLRERCATAEQAAQGGAQAQGRLAHLTQQLAQAEEVAAQWQRKATHFEAEAAQAASIDRVAIAHRLNELGQSNRLVGELLRVSESTVRNWLKKTAAQGAV